jgi:ABC-type sugar transport system ATPase subunit
VHALVGENGAGKCTLMKILSGNLQPDAGRILLKGRETRFADPGEAIAAGIGTIHQELTVIPDLSVAENIFSATLPTGRLGIVSRRLLADRAAAACRDRLKRPPAWIAQIGTEVKRRTKRTTVCTLQAVPLYLDGVHAKEGRNRALDVAELRKAVQNTAWVGVDGLVFFVWSDFLRQVLEQKNSGRLDIIRSTLAPTRNQRGR